MSNSLDEEMKRTEIVAGRLTHILGSLNMGFKLFNYKLPTADDVDIPFILEFQHPQDAKYIAWNILENIEDGYFEEKYVDMLDILIREKDVNLLVVNSETIGKLADVVESLIEDGIINEWQCSKETLELFESMYYDHPDPINWTDKFRGIFHLKVWTTEIAKDMIMDILHILDYMGIQATVTAKPLDEPMVNKINIIDPVKGINLFRQIRLHDKFKEFPKECIISFEQLTTSVPKPDDGLVITITYETMSTLYAILKDLK